MRKLLYILRFMNAFRFTYYRGDDWNVVRLYHWNDCILDISYLDGGPKKGQWVLTLRDDDTGALAHHYSNGKKMDALEILSKGGCMK